MSDNFYQSKEFKDKLRKYEAARQSDGPVYLEADDLTDIAEYYFYHGRNKEALETADYAISVFPGALHPLAFRARYAILVKGNVDEAFDYAHQIADQQDLDYLYTIAEILIANGEEDKAEQYLEDKENDVDDDDLEDYYLDVAALFADYSCTALAQHWLEKSFDTEALDYKELQGRIAMDKGNYDESERIFNKLIDEDPYAVSYWNQLASSQYLHRNLQASIESSEFSLAIDPDDFDAVLNKANGLLEMGNYDEAAKYYARFKKLQPLNEAGDMGIASVCIAQGRMAEALDHLTEAEKRCTPQSINRWDILRQKFMTLTALRRFDEAYDCIDELESTRGSNKAEMNVMRGYLHLQQDDKESAMRWFGTAVRMGAADELHIRALIAYSAYESNYIQLARTQYALIVDRVKKGSWSGGWAFMALCDHELGQREHFLTELAKAVSTDKDNAVNFLSALFPKGMAADDYLSYALLHKAMATMPQPDNKD